MQEVVRILDFIVPLTHVLLSEQYDGNVVHCQEVVISSDDFRTEFDSVA